MVRSNEVNWYILFDTKGLWLYVLNNFSLEKVLSPLAHLLVVLTDYAKFPGILQQLYPGRI